MDKVAARGRQHLVQTLRWLLNRLRQLLEAHRRVHQIAKNQLGCVGLAVQALPAALTFSTAIAAETIAM